MTYDQAKLRIWNPQAYTSDEVRRAAILILSSLGASQEDIDQASNLF